MSENRLKLLIFTQKVDRNDATLGFFIRWIEEFAKSWEHVTVICLLKGEYSLPSNVEVLSLGKECRESRVQYTFLFFRYIWQKRREYDSVFIHMNVEYAVLGGVLWRLLNKRIILWYAHRQTSWRLWIAEKLSHMVVSSAPESFRLKSRKIKFMNGPGVDVDMFKCSPRMSNSDRIRILSVGRITRIKNCDTLIKAVRILAERGKEFQLVFAGEAVTDDDMVYYADLKKLVTDYGLADRVQFIGGVTGSNLVREYCTADLTVNMVPVGGLDKVVIESMSAGVPVLTSNSAYGKYFGEYKDRLIFKERDEKDLADKIIGLSSDSLRSGVEKLFPKQARENFDISRFVRIVTKYLKE